MSEKESLHKEFELERLVLFSDAVFAIAITLLILEIKFPEVPEDLKSKDIFSFFKPTLIHFFAFAISFLFIGVSWSRHLALCKYLLRYNNNVIILNLLLLFFIVTFPFSISAFVDNISSSFFIAIFIYMLNIFFVTMMQYRFTHYILRKNPSLAVAGMHEEKLYFYMKTKYSFFMLLATVVIMLTVIIISKGNYFATAISLYVLPILAIIMRFRLKKYKPKTA